MYNEFTKKELLIIWALLIQSAANNEKLMDAKLAEMFEKLGSLPGGDFEKRRSLRDDIIDTITSDGNHIDRLQNLANRIKSIEKTRQEEQGVD